MTKTRKRISTFILSIIAALSMVMMTSCGGKKDGKKKNEDAKAAFTVSVREIAPETMEDYIEFGGTVKAVDSVEILPSVAGKIARISVKGGDRVNRGDVIAQIDPSKPGAEFALSPVKATSSGTVTKLPLSVGAYATTSTTIAEISSTDDLEIDINVSERFVPLIKEGQAALVTFKSYPEEFFEAKVERISPILDPSTRTMEVTLNIEETKGIVKAGMFAHVKLITQTKNDVLSLPNRAIVYNGGKPYVFVADSTGENASVSRIPVTTGLSVDGKTEITSGLSEGNLAIVKGQNMISEGQKVNALLQKDE
nr:efflux RND transporter periplasmic adaptor subunit [Treponema sp.]